MKHYKKLLGIICLGLGLTTTGVVLAEPKVSTRGGIQVGEQTEDFWFTVSGGIRLDQIFFSGNTQSKGKEFKSGADIHRSWIDFDGGLGKNTTYSIDFTIAGDGKIELGDAYATYTGLGENIDLSIGQLSAGFSLQSTSSSKWTAFLERSLDSRAFNVSSGLGVNMTKWSDIYSLNLTAIQPKKGATTINANGTPKSRSDRWVLSARATYNPFINLEENKVFQVGASASYHDDSNAGITFKTFPEAHTRDTGYALNTSILDNSGKITKAIGSKHHELYAVEISGQNGPLYAEAEYHLARIHRSANLGSNLKFKGWHVQGTYVLTGEARKYKTRSGTFEQVIPFTDKGAWEVAARYSTVNLNDKDVYGGIGKNATLGLNYYANKNIKVAANYIRSKQKTTVNQNTTVNRKLNIFGARLQLVF